MCGIITILSKKKKNKKNLYGQLVNIYSDQKARGSEGFGYVGIEGNEMKTYQRAKTEEEIKEILKKDIDNISGLMFHHRFPTSTPNIIEACHPIKVKNKRLDNTYFVIHNGIITNDGELRKSHYALGYKYTTKIRKTEIIQTKGKKVESVELYFNDSEAFAIELAEYIEGKKEKIDTKGSIAFVALQVNRKDKISKVFFGRNSGNPLIMKNKENYFSLSSQSEGKGQLISEDVLYSLDPRNTEVVTQKSCKIGAVNSYANYERHYYGYNGVYDDDRAYGKNSKIDFNKDEEMENEPSETKKVYPKSNPELSDDYIEITANSLLHYSAMEWQQLGYEEPEDVCEELDTEKCLLIKLINRATKLNDIGMVESCAKRLSKLSSVMTALENGTELPVINIKD